MANKQEKRKRKKAKEEMKIHPKPLKKSKRKKTIFILILLFFVISFVFSPVFNNEFLNYDDGMVITENPLVANDGKFEFAEFFTTKIYTPHYKPLTYLSWNLEYRLFGFNPIIFHFNNFLLHLLNTLLVFIIAGRLVRNYSWKSNIKFYAPFIISLLFAIHPLKVESVAWAVERKDVLYSFFFLLSLLSYLYFAEKEKRGKYIWVSAFLYLFSLLSKSMGITLIAALFLIDIILKRQFNKNLFLEKIPHFLVFIFGFFLFGMFTDFGVQASGLTEGVVNSGFNNYPSNFDGLGSFYIRVLIISIRIILWIAHIIIPVGLSAFYPKQELLQSLGMTIHLFPLLVMLIGSAAIWLIRKKTWISFGILFFLVTLSPAIAVSDNGIGVFLSDRYTYIPSLGLIFLFVVLLSNWASKKNKTMLIFIPSGILILVFSLMSFNYTKKWRNSEIFWTNVISKSQNETHAYNGRGRHYFAEKFYPKALEDFNLAIKTDPDNFVAYSNRGKVYFEMKNYEQAITDFSKCVELNSRYYEAFANRGTSYAILGNYDKSLLDFNKTLELKPDHAISLKNRGILWMNKGEYNKVIKDLSKYLAISGDDADIQNTISVAWLNLENYKEALENFNRAIRLAPTKGDYYKNRAICHKRMGNLQLAIRDAKSASDLGSSLPPELGDLLNQ